MFVIFASELVAQYGASEAKELIEPLFNDMFVRLFGSERSKDMTRGMVNSFLRRAGIEEIGEIERIDAEFTDIGGSIDCKSARYDVRITAADRLVDLEAQRFADDIENRSMFYAARMLSSHSMKGKGYKDLPQAVVITLLDTRPYFSKTSEIVSTCRMQWNLDSGVVEGTDRVLFVLVDIAKAKARYTSVEDALESEDAAWIYLLASGFRNREEVDMLAEKFPTIEEFAQMYGIALDDPDIVRAYDLYDECWREERSRQDALMRIEHEAAEKAAAAGRERGMREGLEKGMQEGLEKGMQEGLEKGMQEGLEKGMNTLADKLREMGVDEALIAKALEDAAQV